MSIWKLGCSSGLHPVPTSIGFDDQEIQRYPTHLYIGNLAYVCVPKACKNNCYVKRNIQWGESRAGTGAIVPCRNRGYRIPDMRVVEVRKFWYRLFDTHGLQIPPFSCLSYRHELHFAQSCRNGAGRKISARRNQRSIVEDFSLLLEMTRSK